MTEAGEAGQPHQHLMLPPLEQVITASATCASGLPKLTKLLQAGSSVCNGMIKTAPLLMYQMEVMHVK